MVMKQVFTFLLGVLLANITAQVDTFTWDVSKLQLFDQKYSDGYHMFKKNGITIKEYNRVNGRSSGVCKDYYDNGNLKLVYETGFFEICSSLTGPYCEYYESGKIKTDGAYAFADSIACINCYDRDGERPVTKAHSHSEKAGLWQEFFENGALKSSGHYKGIHETTHIVHPKPVYKNGAGVFTPGDYTEDYLKDKQWSYYNEQGQLIKEEFYYNGSLTDQEIYQY